MSKLKFHIVAILACFAYVFLYGFIFAFTGFDTKDFGSIFHIFCLGMPTMFIWKRITGLSKKELTDNKKDDTQNPSKQEN